MRKEDAMKYAIIVLAIVVIGVVALKSMARPGDKSPAVGSAAPDFTLNSQDGAPVSLHDFKGKWVVLYFYPKDFTSGGTVVSHNFQREMEMHQLKKERSSVVHVKM